MRLAGPHFQPLRARTHGLWDDARFRERSQSGEGSPCGPSDDKEKRVTQLKLALAALTACAVGASAHAGDTNSAFAAFATVCAGPAADFTAVKAAADSQGWGPTATTADANMPGVTIGEKLTRATIVDKSGLILSAWRGTKGSVKISDCTIHIAKADYPAVVDATKAWLAFPAQDSTAKRSIFRFTDVGGAHKALTPTEFDVAASGGGLEILTVSGDENGTVLDLMMIKK